jgi:hypothetical protein
MGAQGGHLQGNLTTVLQFLGWAVQRFAQEIRLCTCQPAIQASRFRNWIQSTLFISGYILAQHPRRECKLTTAQSTQNTVSTVRSLGLPAIFSGLSNSQASRRKTILNVSATWSKPYNLFCVFLPSRIWVRSAPHFFPHWPSSCL